jgi:hypothetical protein
VHSKGQSVAELCGKATLCTLTYSDYFDQVICQIGAHSPSFYNAIKLDNCLRSVIYCQLLLFVVNQLDDGVRRLGRYKGLNYVLFIASSMSLLPLETSSLIERI